MTTERPPLNLDIDEHNLHAEFAELPGMFAVWKRHQAQVESDLDQAEAERDLEIAKAADRLRKGTEKTTETWKLPWRTGMRTPGSGWRSKARC